MHCDLTNFYHGSAITLRNQCIAEETYRLVVEAENELPKIEPGQFVMLRLPNRTDPLLGRPLAVYKIDKNVLEVVYIVVGKMTARLAEVKPGDKLEFWTPLGNGFPQVDVEHTIMVAGGIGQTPFLMLAENLCEKQAHCTLLYGARSVSRIACIEDFEHLGVDVHIATDDGSRGYHGRITDLIETVYQSGETTRILCCGPHPMLEAAFKIAQKYNLPCEVSLETPMGCGLGICFGCVVKYRNDTDDGGWDYRRTCVDGPVFDAYRLSWP